MIIITIGLGAPTYFIEPQDPIMSQLNEELIEMNTFREPSYFGEDRKREKKMAHEDKVKQSQAYKKKNQRHPAFRK